MKRFVLVLVATVAVAGCLGGNGDGTDGNGAGMARQPWGLNVDAQDCDGATVAILVEPSQAYQHLPPGYTPRDAQGLFQTGAATGKIPVFVAALNCDEAVGNDLSPSNYSLAFASVFVEPPSVPGFRTSAEYDFYVTHFYTDHTQLHDRLAAEAWQVSLAGISSNVTVLPNGGAAAFAQITDDEGDVVAMNLGGPAAIPANVPGVGFQDWSLRLWHQTAHGVGYMDYRFSLDVPTGSGTCTFRPDSPAATTSGHRSCPPYHYDMGLTGGQEPEGSDSTMAAMFPELDLTGMVQWLPGVAAA